MRRNILIIAIVLFTSLAYISCSKSSDSDDVDPCTGVTVSVTGTVTSTPAGQSSGSIVASATGGTGFTYSLNNGAFQSSGTFNNLAAGTYTVTAKNSNGCIGSQQFTVTGTSACAGSSITITSNTTRQFLVGVQQGVLQLRLLAVPDLRIA